MSDRSSQYDDIRKNGYCVFPNVLDADMIERLRTVTSRLLAGQSETSRKQYRYQGSDIHLQFQDPVFADLIAWPKSVHCLRQLGFNRPKFWLGTIIGKPPGGPPLYWHQDWPFWDDPISASPDPSQLFLMYYLTDTTPQNGCLRVIPGSHRTKVPLHDQLPPAHSPETLAADLSSPMFSTQSDEVDVKVSAGDLVVGDARVLHAAHANRSQLNRTVLTLWYVPSFDTLPDRLRASFCQRSASPPPVNATERDLRLVEPLIPRYEGDAKPAAWNRVPGKYIDPFRRPPE